MDPILKIKDLTVDIGEKRVLDSVDMELVPGKITAVVGESGSGKTLTALSVLDLAPRTAKYVSGSVVFAGTDIRAMGEEEKRNIRGGKIGMVFQEPFTALNPVMKVGVQVEEAIAAHSSMRPKQVRQKARKIFGTVHLSEKVSGMYPFELSGGMRQRVMLAIGLSCDPEILILDEPTTALDVSIQKKVLELIKGIQDERSLTMLFITHDLSIVNSIADMVIVMKRGKIVERGPKDRVINDPRHPYTRKLLECIPRLGDKRRRLPEIEG